MKKLLLPAFLLLINLTCFAQRIGVVHAVPGQIIYPGAATNSPSAKTTAPGDTLILRNSSDTLPTTAYSLGADSGYVAGTDYWGDKAFAERYDVTDSPTNMQIVGLLAAFHGKVNPLSTKSVTFTVWSQGDPRYITGSKVYNGFPKGIIDSISVPITQLGIGATHDTMKKFFFPNGTWNMRGPFFVGYSINYDFLSLGGDTIGLYSTYNGHRNPSALYSYSYNITDLGDTTLLPDTTLVTTVNVQNATLGSDNIWYDNFTQDDSLFNNLAIYPIAIKGFPVSTGGITRNTLTFYGNYPNPCTSSTNIRFALNNNSSVTIDVMDMSSKVVNTVKQEHLTKGEHTITLNTTSLPSGDYLYLVRTSSGDGIAGKMTVVNSK